MALILLIMTAGPSFAHKVIVFAWVEDGNIYTQSSFGGKRKAKNCKIVVVDEKGTVVHKGMTDENGDHAFKIPKGVNSDLTINLEAGAGHKAHWLIAYDEISLPSDSSTTDAMTVKQNLEKGPSFFKILGGLGIIFLLAFVLKRFKRKSGVND